MPNSSKPSAGRGPSVILLEEYQPIAVALRVALQRAAPEMDDLRVFPSLSETEAAISQRGADLVIIDVDPPHRGTVDFFNKVKETLPATKALIIAPQNVPEVGAATGGMRAFHFIKKPFELWKFAAVVKRLLPASGFDTGTLRNLTLLDLILLQAGSGSTTVLLVEAPDGRRGEIHFAEGRICHAVLLGETGIDALHEMLRWSAVRYGEMDRPLDAPRTIKGDWKRVLLPERRAAHISEALGQDAQTATAPEPKPAAGQPRKKLVIIDDTEMLLIFLKEILATSNPPLEILTAKSGLEGADLIARVKPDLVLLDYSLPDINGSEVCRRLLDDESVANVPIIMMSGHEAEMGAAFENCENVIATIAKPFLSESLLELVERTVSNLPRLVARPRKRKQGARRQFEKTGRGSAAAAGESRNGRSKREIAQPSDSPALSESQLPAAPAQIPTEPAPPPLELRAGASSAQLPEGREDMPSVQSPAQPSYDPALPPAALSERSPNETRIAPAAPDEIPPAPPKRSDTVSAPVSGIAPVAIRAARYNAVVLHLPLEIISLRFSPSLRITAIRARPSSQIVSLHMLPEAVAGAVITQTGFKIARVDLDSHSQLNTVHLTPARQPPAPAEAGSEIPVQELVVLSSESGRTVELTPTPAAPLRMQLVAPFELCSVELSPEFGIGHLLLRSTGGKMRINLQPDVTESGATFESAQFLLDRSAQIAEVLLDIPV